MKTSFELTAKQVSSFLFKMIACLLVLGTISNYLKNKLQKPHAFGFVPLFDLDGEYNPPALYSALAIWFSAGLLWVIHAQQKKGGYKGRHWKILSFMFAYLGLDELAGIHECFSKVGPYVSRYIYLPSDYSYWVIPFCLLLVVVAAYFLGFFLRLPKSTQLQFILAGGVYVGGAVGMELVGGWYDKTVLGGVYNIAWHPQAFTMGLLVTAEEGMEMMGIALFIRSLLIYLRQMGSYPRVDIALRCEAKPKANETVRREATLSSRKQPVVHAE